MADNIPYLKCFVPKTREEEEDDERIYHRYREIISTLPAEKSLTNKPIYQYQGFWHNPDVVGVGPLAFHDHFKASPTDILLATTPKSGTTWLKSLIFAIMNRKLHPPTTAQHPLVVFNSHNLVPTLELVPYNDIFNNNRIPDFDLLPSPRLLATHMPYTSLPQSMVDSCCRIIYLCRTIKDTFVSYWHFINKGRAQFSLMPLTLEDTLERFCKGITGSGPIWDHVLEYWKASLQRPTSVLFLKYEEMQAEPVVHLKRVAEFMGRPFSSEEEREGVVDEIIKLCSFENLTSLEVNNSGVDAHGLKYNAYFRKGKVGDSGNYLTSEMIERLDSITEQKFHGHGLTL